MSAIIGARISGVQVVATPTPTQGIPVPIMVQAAAPVEMTQEEEYKATGTILVQVPVKGYDLFNSAEAVKIMEIKWRDGTRAITIANRALLYEVFYLLTTTLNVEAKDADGVKFKKPLSLDERVAALTQTFNTLLLSEYPGSSAVTETFVFDKELNEYVAEKDRMRSAVSIVQGVNQCIQCGTYKTLTITAQLHSADEPMTQQNKCLACGKMWSIYG